MKWIGIGIGGLLGIAPIAGLAMYIFSEVRRNATFCLHVEIINFHRDEESSTADKRSRI
jgi:hypothetical protein